MSWSQCPRYNEAPLHLDALTRMQTHIILVSLYYMYVELIRFIRYGIALFCILFVLHLMSVHFLGFLSDFLGGGGGRYSWNWLVFERVFFMKDRHKFSLRSLRTKVKTAHTFCTHSAPILHGYYCGLGNENCGGMSQLQPEQKAHCQPSWGLIIRSECRSSSFTDECILNEKLITTCWNCSSIQRQLSAC